MGFSTESSMCSTQTRVIFNSAVDLKVLIFCHEWDPPHSWGVFDTMAYAMVLQPANKSFAPIILSSA